MIPTVYVVGQMYQSNVLVAITAQRLTRRYHVILVIIVALEVLNLIDAR